MISELENLPPNLIFFRPGWGWGGEGAVSGSKDENNKLLKLVFTVFCKKIGVAENMIGKSKFSDFDNVFSKLEFPESSCRS